MVEIESPFEFLELASDGRMDALAKHAIVGGQIGTAEPIVVVRLANESQLSVFWNACSISLSSRWTILHVFSKCARNEPCSRNARDVSRSASLLPE